MDVKTNTASNYENLWVCSAHWCISYCLRYKLWFTERLKTIGNFTGIFKRRMKRIDSSYKLIELPQFLDALRRSANTIRMTDSGWSEEISCRMLQLPTIKLIAQFFLYLCIRKLLSNFVQFFRQGIIVINYYSVYWHILADQKTSTLQLQLPQLRDFYTPAISSTT